MIRSLRLVLLNWWRAFRIRSNAFINTILVIIALITFILPDVSWQVKIGIVAILICYLLYCAIISIPTFYLNLQGAGSKPISIADKDSILQEARFVGLIGLHSAGKTTFLKAVRSEGGVVEATETTTINGLAMPKSGEVVGIVDSVGSVIESQFEVIDASDLLVIFIDHNENKYKRISNNRLSSHSGFIRDIISRQEYKNNGVKKVILVLNKSDLWLGSRADMSTRYNFANISTDLRSSSVFSVVAEIAPYSNENVKDVVRLISEVEAGLKDG